MNTSVLALLSRLKKGAVPAKDLPPVDPSKRSQKAEDEGETNLIEISFDGLSSVEIRRLIKDLDLSIAQVLVILANSGDFFHDSHRVAYVSFSVDGNTETMPVRSSDFRLYLQRQYYRTLQKVANSQALSDALGVLEARALFDGPMMPVFIRVAEQGGKVYLDLVDPSWRVVEIIPGGGWALKKDSPVKFIRRPGMLPLPEPQPGGSIDELRPFLNLPEGETGDTAWRLLVSWLVMAFRPTGPYAILSLHGPQGCCKTTLARMLRALIDPNSSPLRAEPKEVRDLLIWARNSWTLGLDNLTKLPQWLSDGLCRLATGGGFATRTLYTDGDESIFEAMRPVILTAINTVGTSHDLSDRQILVELKPMEDTERREELEIWRSFEAAWPRILGALLDGVSTALFRQEFLKLSRLPRMADFAKFATAAEEAWGWDDGSFVAAYDANRAGIVQASIDSDLVASTLCQFMERRNEWEGTASDLLDELKALLPEDVLKLKIGKTYAFPQLANVLTRRLRKAEVFLKQRGITIAKGRDALERNILITRQDGGNTVITVTTVIGQENQRVTHDGISGDIVMGQDDTVMPGNGGEIHDGTSSGNDDMDGNTVMRNPLKLQGHDGYDVNDDVSLSLDEGEL